MIAPARPTTKPIHAINELEQQVNDLQAKLSAEAESYRLIISTMAATCRMLQARVRTLEAERLESVAEEGQPTVGTPASLPLSGGRTRRRHTARAMSWPTIIPEESLLRGDSSLPPSRGTSPVDSEAHEPALPPSPSSAALYPVHISIDALVFHKACQSWS